jgi:hypothetical protein
MGRLESNTGTHLCTHYPRWPYPNKTKKPKKKEDSAKLGTDSEHQKSKDYSTQQHGNLNNSSTLRKTTFLQGLSPTDSIGYSPWKVTKKSQHITKSSPPLRTPQGTWARNNAHAFAKHLEQVFQPHPLENILEEEEEEEEDLIQFLEAPYQPEPQSNASKKTEVQEIINSLNPKKRQGTT